MVPVRHKAKIVSLMQSGITQQEIYCVGSTYGNRVPKCDVTKILLLDYCKSGLKF